MNLIKHNAGHPHQTRKVTQSDAKPQLWACLLLFSSLSGESGEHHKGHGELGVYPPPPQFRCLYMLGVLYLQRLGGHSGFQLKLLSRATTNSAAATRPSCGDFWNPISPLPLEKFPAGRTSLSLSLTGSSAITCRPGSLLGDFAPTHSIRLNK